MTQNIIDIVDTLGLLQGLIFGLIFLVHSRKNKHFLYYSLFLLTYSLELIINLVESFGFLKKYPNLEYLPFNFYFLTIPLFYLYVKKTSIFNNQKINYLILIPGIIELIIGIILFVTNKNSVFFEVLSVFLELISFLLMIPYNLFILILLIKLIEKHKKLIIHQYSNTNEFSLKWSKNIAVILVLFLVLYFIFNLLSIKWDNLVLELIFSIINVGMIYWLSLKGLEQKMAHSYINLHDYKESKKSKITLLQQKEIEKNFMLINELIKKEELYKTVDLTILDISNTSKLSTKKISQAVNTFSNNNFNTYINKFRINVAKKMLTNNKFNYLSIEGIGNESGFKSKSVFYKTFKSETGLTPKRYRESVLGTKS